MAIALTMRRHTAALEAVPDTGFGTVVVSGGGSACDLMMQLFADVFGRPAVRPAVRAAVGLRLTTYSG